VSDWHGQLDPLSETVNNVTTTYGGLGLLKVYIDQARAENANTIFLTGGDNIGATPALSTVFDDRPAIEGLNFLGLKATTFGNHEFDHGVDNLKARLDEAAFTYVSTNLTNADAELGGKLITPYRMIEMGDKDPRVKVALLGLTNEDAPSLIFPGVLKTMTVSDPVAAANQAAKDARAAGAALVIAMVHEGATAKDNAGVPSGPAIDFASGLTGVDVVVADHTDITVNNTFGNALVVENRSKGRTYSKIQVSVVDGKVKSTSAETFNPSGTETIGNITCPATSCPDLTYTCNAQSRCVKTLQAPDPAAATLLQPFRDQLAARFDAGATKTDGIFVRDGTGERLREVPIGDLIADVMLERYRTSDGIQLAFTNGGGIRASLPSSYAVQNTALVRIGCSGATPCDVVAGDIYTVLPFGNAMVVRSITGAVLWQALEYSVGALPAVNGRFLQIAGFKYTYSASAAVGSRVQSVQLVDQQGVVIKDILRDDQTSYKMVTNDFTNAGGGRITAVP
jgi:5'-nucleotidase